MRNKTVDIAKGLGILLIVFGHNWIVLHGKGELFRIIFSFHVPLFFFLSGVFLKETESLPSLLKSKTDSLLKPYFVVSCGLGLANAVAGKTSLGYFVGIFYSTGSTIDWTPLWFLPHLFVVIIFSWLTVKIFTNNLLNRKLLALVPGLFLLSGVLTIQMFWLRPLSDFGGPYVLFGKRALLPGLPFSIDIILVSSAYLLAGHGMSKYVQRLTFNPFLFVCSSSIFFALHWFFDETMDLNLRIYGNLVISSLQAFSGIYIVLSISSLFSSFRRFGSVVAYVGSGSMFILIFHWFIMHYTNVLFDAHAPSIPYINSFFAFLLGVGIPLILLEITKKQWLLSALLLPRKSGRKLLPI